MAKEPATVPDSWSTESGLPDDFDLLIEEAWFGPNEESERDPDKIYLNFRGPAEIKGEPIGDEEEGLTLRYPVGKNWDVVKGGKAVEHASGATKFATQAGTGFLVDAIAELAAEEAVLMEALSDRGAPTLAATWVDFNLHFERQLVSKFKSEEDEDVEWKLPIPTGFNGIGGGDSEEEETPKKKSATKKKAKESDDDDTDSDLRDKVLAFARKFDDDEHTDFVEEVLDVDVFDEADDIDEELKAEIMDEDSKLWRKAHR